MVETNGWSLGWQNALASMAEFIPRLLAFLVILVVGYFVAAMLGKLLDKGLEKIDFDRAVERGGIKRAMARSGYDPSTLIGKLLFYVLMLFVLQFAFAVFGPNPISDLINQAIAYIPNIIVAVAIVVIAAAIANAVRDMVSGSMGGLPYGMFIAAAAHIGILVVGVFMALNQLNIAPEIVNGLFYAALAIIVGVAVVGVGGGLISPMRARWENALNKVDAEVPRIRDRSMADMRAPQRPPGEGYVS